MAPRIALLVVAFAIVHAAAAQNVLSVLQSVVAGNSGKTSFSNIGKFVNKIANSPPLQPILASTAFDGVISVFAPIDSAWDAAGYDNLDPATLAEVLQYHVVARDLNYVFLPNAPCFAPTFLGLLSNATLAAPSPQWVYVLNEYVSTKVMGNFSTTGGLPSRGLEPLDAFTSDNALVYVMPTVMTPPPTISAVLANWQAASTFLGLLGGAIKAQVDSVPFPGATFFIPTNDAISSFGAGAWDANNAMLADMIKHHVVVGTSRPVFLSRQADPVKLGPFPEGLSGMNVGEIRSYSTLAGSLVTVTRRSDGVYVNGDSLIVQGDILCAQGVIHLISKPLVSTVGSASPSSTLASSAPAPTPTMATNSMTQTSARPTSSATLSTTPAAGPAAASGQNVKPSSASKSNSPVALFALIATAALGITAL
ncbi:FAS1 domain-containing protein [Gonapodya prolifera JEL478]|uniref:FAS1 domain-containing protein n=1 Tax=Gonapodya prolifera (strain JEL478) TaxID=1344416 RepID=A0A139AVS4_GONPJ|nr:FAS1 domain-containing protein [Gonapodya prolifera JEL478]|eukprot:KXS20575.1 FAS1 domain-containing protein [Gonapodya prolifera JEL478]